MGKLAATKEKKKAIELSDSFHQRQGIFICMAHFIHKATLLDSSKSTPPKRKEPEDSPQLKKYCISNGKIKPQAEIARTTLEH